jgi:Asp-tRNA(Asn)/Glu-tRNA(Gln) amidotransferase A subunit family amidase
MLSEMARSLTFEREHFSKKLNPLLLKQLNDGSAISYDQYAQDLLATQVAKGSINDLFNSDIDVLIAPSAIGEAPAFHEGTGDPIFCRGWTLLGLPCINLNVGTGPNGLPVGVQLIAGPGKDHFLLSFARVFAKSLPDPVLRDQA